MICPFLNIVHISVVLLYTVQNQSLDPKLELIDWKLTLIFLFLHGSQALLGVALYPGVLSDVLLLEAIGTSAISGIAGLEFEDGLRCV